MRYSLKPKYRKYVHGYGFLLFARKFGNKYGKKIVDAAAKPLINKHGKNIMDTAKKSGIDAAKIASKRVV